MTLTDEERKANQKKYDSKPEYKEATARLIKSKIT